MNDMDSNAENQEALHASDCQALDLEAEIARLRTECADLTKQADWWQSELDNVEKRLLRNKQEVMDRTRQEVLTPIIECMDDFRLALKSEGSYEQLREGIEIVVRKHQGIGGKSTILSAPEHTPSAS